MPTVFVKTIHNAELLVINDSKERCKPNLQNVFWIEI